MKQLVILLSLALFINACQTSNPAKENETASTETITKEEALNLLHTWTNAYLSGDVTPLNDVLDDAWIYSGSSDGSTTDKASAIGEFANADYTFSEIVYQDLDVRLFEDIAVVRGSERMVIVGNSGADTTVLRLRFTDVYQKKDGSVKAIATHSSPISDE